jgi:3-hydroxyisobutyrate dehydrogenase-like beta-hydroxyacid dehydrogenase
MATVGILHPGEMGAAVGAALVANGHTVLWTSAGRSARTAERARAAGLIDGDVTRSDFLLAICPPDAARDVARSLAGYSGIYVDANAIAPQTAATIAATLTFVDGGIIGPPPERPGTTRLYLSGAHAEAVAQLFAGSVLEARVIEGSASALKMAYAAWTKGSAALLLAIEATARELGVDHDLHAEWALSQPQLDDRLAAAERAAATKGWRWAGEMREIAATFATAGQPAGFHRAAAEVYER